MSANDKTPMNLFVKRIGNSEINDGVKLELFRNTYETLYKDAFMNVAKNTNIFDGYFENCEIFIDAPKMLLSSTSIINANGLEDGIFLLHVAALLSGEKISLYGRRPENSIDEKIATIQIHPETGYKVDVFNNHNAKTSANLSLNRVKLYDPSIKKMLDRYNPTTDEEGEFGIEIDGESNASANRYLGIVSTISQIVSNPKYDINKNMDIVLLDDDSAIRRYICTINKISNSSFYIKLPSYYRSTETAPIEYSIDDLHKLAYSIPIELICECLTTIENISNLEAGSTLSENDMCTIIKNIKGLLRMR